MEVLKTQPVNNASFVLSHLLEHRLREIKMVLGRITPASIIVSARSITTSIEGSMSINPTTIAIERIATAKSTNGGIFVYKKWLMKMKNGVVNTLWEVSLGSV
ncbi:hypothetical protein M8C21_022312, partial [Ambrosia artemisiifolia]